MRPLKDEDDGLFKMTTAGIQRLIETKKEQFVFSEELVNQIVSDIQATENYYTYTQLHTAGAAIVISARILLTNSTYPERLALIPLFEQGLEMISNFDNLNSFYWKNCQPLFHLYLEHIPQDSPGATKFLKLLLKIFDCLKTSDKVKPDLFSYHSVLTIARVIHVTMDLIANRRDLEVRKMALEVLSKIIEHCPPEKAPAVSLFISGFLSRLVIFLKNDDINGTLVQRSLSLFTDAIVLVFADNAPKFDISQVDLNDFPEQMHCIFLNQTEEWRMQGADRIFEYINEMLVRYMLHRNMSIRKVSTELVLKIQTACPKFFGERMFFHLLFLYKQLRFDNYPDFQTVAKQALHLVSNKRMCQEYFYTQLDFHITNLPVQSRISEGIPDINKMCALLEGIGDGVRLMCTTGSETIERLLRSLADSVEINKRRIMISSDAPAENCLQALGKMKLLYDMNHETVQRICGILATLGGIEIIDMVHNLMRIESPGKRASYHIILGYFLSGLDLETTPSDEPIILMLAEYLVRETNRLCVVAAVNDSIPTNHQTEIDWETCVESLSLTNVALCMKFIGQTGNRSNISINCLCTILMQSTSTSWIVSESAAFALKILAEQDKNTESVNDLIEIYSSHILHRVSMACSSSTDYLMAPILLVGFLKHSNVSKQFDVTKVIVEKLLYSLDNNEQRYVYTILKALHFFMETLIDEYPDQEPLPPAEGSEDDKRLPTPQHIITEKILLRTKHLLTSDYLPVQVIAIKLLSLGLELLKKYDDMLLPMIHQNWFGLMVIVKNLNTVVLPMVIDVIVDMAEVSGTFVHNKVLKEFWPSVEKYFMHQIRRTDNFDHTLDFANATKIISVAPQLVTWAGLSEKEADASILQIYTVSLEIKGQFAFYARVQKRKTDRFYHQGIPVQRDTAE